MPFRKVLWLFVLCPLAWHTSNASEQNGPSGDRSGPTPESMAVANLVQSILNCMHDFEGSTKYRPETVTLADRRTFTAFNLKDVTPPRLGNNATCSFAVIGVTSDGRWWANPVCKVGPTWRAFGSGYGPVIWAKPSFSCRGASGV